MLPATCCDFGFIEAEEVEEKKQVALKREPFAFDFQRRAVQRKWKSKQQNIAQKRKPAAGQTHRE
jgi:hypothetical protein